MERDRLQQQEQDQRRQEIEAVALESNGMNVVRGGVDDY